MACYFLRHEISEREHSYLSMCPQSTSIFGHTRLQQQLTEYSQIKFLPKQECQITSNKESRNYLKYHKYKSKVLCIEKHQNFSFQIKQSNMLTKKSCSLKDTEKEKLQEHFNT